MAKDKKSKLTKMEKLRRILDNPYDPTIKNFISKEDGNLENVRRKLSGKISQKKDQLQPSESLIKQSAKFEQTIDVSGKKEEITKTKQSEESSIGIDGEDLIEVEKEGVSKKEFVEIISEEKTEEKEPVKKLEKKEDGTQETPELIQIEKKTESQISTETITIDKQPVADEKLKIIDFKDADKDEVYWKTKKGLLSSDKIQIYKPITISETWAFTIIIFIVAISGLFLLRDWLFLNFGIYGDKFILTPKGILNIHIWSSFIFVLLGLFHIAIHIFSRNKEILPIKTQQDFKSFLHSGLYLIGFARKEDYRTSGIFTGRQKITYIALVYILGLAAITGLLFYFDFLSSNLELVHIIPAGLSIMVLLFHFLITIRKHDLIALRCVFYDGKIPRGYARKKSPIWFKEINKKRESTIRRIPNAMHHQSSNVLGGKNNLDNALLKFALLLNENPDKEDIKVITSRLKTMVSAEDLKRIIELAEELDDKLEENNNQKSEDENQQSEEDLKDLEDLKEKK